MSQVPINMDAYKDVHMEMYLEEYRQCFTFWKKEGVYVYKVIYIYILLVLYLPIWREAELHIYCFISHSKCEAVHAFF